MAERSGSPGFHVDILVVGAGPAGTVAARVAANAGASVLVVEQRPNVGLPVQCAEYVPARIADHVALPARCIAQRISSLQTTLPDGETVHTLSRGYVIDRALFDRSLAVEAHRAGAHIWTRARALERTERGVLVRRGSAVIEVESQIVIGADGPRSTVASWIGQSNRAFIDAHQVEIVLAEPMDGTEVYFHTCYRGGYGWRFPKGDTANMGVGVSRAMGGDPRQALEHFLESLRVAPGDIIGRTAGPVPSGGLVSQPARGNILLAGDAAGLAHPITGAGILAAVISGELAGCAAGSAVESADLGRLAAYAEDLDGYLGGSLRHALARREQLDAEWCDDPGALADSLRETWIAFRAYGRRSRPLD